MNDLLGGGANIIHHAAAENNNKNLMTLTEAELEWAWEIKAALSEDDENRQFDLPLKPIMDYEIAQLAVVTHDEEDMHSVMDRVFRIQCLRDEYRLDDTPEDGVECLRWLTQEQQPGNVVAFDKAPSTESYVAVFDFAKMKPSSLQVPNDWRMYLGAYYYLLAGACPNFASIREGMVTIIECDGMEPSNFSHTMQQRWAEEMAMPYPVHSKESIWLNTPLVANLMCAFVKPWMNSRTRRWDKIQLGCKLEWFDGRIDDLFNVPSKEAAQERMFANLHKALIERYRNVQTFVLPKLPEDRDEDNGGAETDENEG